MGKKCEYSNQEIVLFIKWSAVRIRPGLPFLMKNNIINFIDSILRMFKV